MLYFCKLKRLFANGRNRIMLYPLKFKPLFFEKIWGGHRIEKILGREGNTYTKCGESWELSGIEGNESEVAEGPLAQNLLTELQEIYMGDLVGEKVFDTYGNAFPLLIKFIDAQEVLSVQVHPDDLLARKRHLPNGKTEMWYVLEAEEGAGLYIGFQKGVTKQDYMRAIADGTIDTLLAFYPVKKGDCFFIPAGTVHAIGKGVLLAEIQQSSDITYRIFDWNRVDNEGKPRSLHLAEAEDAIHFTDNTNFFVNYHLVRNQTIPLVNCKQFVVNVLEFDKIVEKVFAKVDSFVVYICLEGRMRILCEENVICLQKGETVLIPAIITDVQLVPTDVVKVLECYL